MESTAELAGHHAIGIESDNDFSLRINLQNNTASIEIISKEKGVTIPLNKLFPLLKFTPSRKFGFGRFSQEVFFSIPELQENPRAIFFLLHEIGHGVVFFKLVHHDPNLLLARNRAWAKYNTGEKMGDKELDLILSDEREAWEMTIEMVSKIKNDFLIDMFAVFSGNVDEYVRWYTNESLCTYEADVAREKIKNEQEREV